MTTIATNYKSIIIRIVLLIIFIFMLFFVWEIIQNEKSDVKWILYLMCLCVVPICVSIIIGLLGIVKVELDESLDQIIFSRFISRKIVANNEIVGYYNCFYNTNKGTSYARIIKTKDGKLRELNPANLKNPNIVDEYLERKSIEFLGEQRSFYPYTSAL